MSADLLEDVEDQNGTSITLSMDVNGYATLSLYPYENGSPDFQFYPDNDGLLLAEKIENALRNWREHIIKTKEITK